MKLTLGGRGGGVALSAVLVLSLLAPTASAVVFPNPAIPESSRNPRDAGLKRSLYFVVHDENDPFTQQEWDARVAEIREKELQTREFFAQNSGGAYDIYYSDIIDVGIPLTDGMRPGSSSNRGPFTSLVNGIATGTHGKNLSDYYMLTYDVSDTEPWEDQGWGGLSSGNTIYLQGTSVALTNHEIGHQTGAGHAKSLVALNSGPYHTYDWDASTQSYQPYAEGQTLYNPVPFGVSSIEYGNPFDTMGNQSDGHFRARQKFDHDWLDPAQHAQVSTPSNRPTRSYRLYAHDELQSVTNVDGEYGVEETYQDGVLYGLTYTRAGQRFSTTLDRFVNETQTIDIEYRTGADGAFFYLNGALVDMDPDTGNLERLLEVGSTVEDIDFGLSRFAVDTGAIGQDVQDIDFLSFSPEPPTIRPTSWFHFESLGIGQDNIGSYIDLVVTEVERIDRVVGDITLDGQVDQVDYELLIGNWLADTSGLISTDQYAMGDLNLDGRVDLHDVKFFRNAYGLFGQGQVFEFGTPVPEPGALVMLAVLLGAGVRRVRT